MQKPKVLLIGGPTGVGKTKLSLICAKELNGEIISADSVQVYKGLNIGSAKISFNEMEGVTHHFIDILNPKEAFDVDTFRKKAHEIIIKLNNEGKLPIIVGGTGFYMRALLFPYTLGSSSKNLEVRKKYELLLKEKGNEYVYNLLQKVDEESANKLHYNDTKRIIRALEIYETTGKKKSEQTLKLESIYDYTLLALTRDRKELYEAINERVEDMFNKGLLEEVKHLIVEQGLTSNFQSMSAIGYKEFFEYFNKKNTLEEVKEKIKQNTRNYAKRQLTYFKTMPQVHWVNLKDGIEPVISYLKQKF